MKEISERIVVTYGSKADKVWMLPETLNQHSSPGVVAIGWVKMEGEELGGLR